MKTLLIILLLAAPCLAEESVTEKAFREAEESSRRVQEQMDRWNEGMERQEQQWEEFNRNYDRNDSDMKYHYETETGRQYWETDDGLIIEGGNYGGE
jgi:hypothetical protein